MDNIRTNIWVEEGYSDLPANEAHILYSTGELMISKYYRILKSKWEEIYYLSDDTQESAYDQVTYWNKEFKNRIYTFLSELNDDYKNVISQILNSGELRNIEKVYSKRNSEDL